MAERPPVDPPGDGALVCSLALLRGALGGNDEQHGQQEEKDPHRGRSSQILRSGM